MKDYDVIVTIVLNLSKTRNSDDIICQFTLDRTGLNVTNAVKDLTRKIFFKSTLNRIVNLFCCIFPQLWLYQFLTTTK